MRIVVVGATGVIGVPLLAAARARGHQVVAGARRPEGDDVRRYDMETAPLAELAPDLATGDFVFLLAAVSSPGACHADPDRAWRFNVEITAARLAEIARAGARAVFPSTDQVFDGAAGGYDEDAAPAPLNHYGRTKAEGERRTLGLAKGSYVVRLGWNVGWDANERCPVRQCYATLLRPGARMATDNAINVTDVRDTVAALLAIVEKRPSPRILHTVASTPVWRAEMARSIAERSVRGKRMAFEPTAFSAIAYPEPRPRLAWLKSRHADALGVRYAAPQDTIARKVDLLDRDLQFATAAAAADAR
jgi:dTDP-4-dehydrorhamnose reductase